MQVSRLGTFYLSPLMHNQQSECHNSVHNGTKVTLKTWQNIFIKKINKKNYNGPFIRINTE